MSDQPLRMAAGGRIDRSRRLVFHFDGRRMAGHPGDTLASALLANGVRLVGRSFKYHRPRGILSAGPEEPNALVTLRSGARAEPNTRATMAELFDGLEAESQHRWPSLRFDAGALNDVVSPFLPAGFYYKTFMGPRPDTRVWMWFEKHIRRAAGLGRASTAPDPDHYAKAHGFADVLVVGGGPAGLAAALAAADGGARVVLAEQMPALGGGLADRWSADGVRWLAEAKAALAAHPSVTVLTRTTVAGWYDGNVFSCVERVADHLPEPAPFQPRQRLHILRARQAVIATGAIEQPLVFADNDRPGVMLAAAAAAFPARYGVRPGRRAVVATTNDGGYDSAFALMDAGVELAAIADSRADPPVWARARAAGAGVPVLAGWTVLGAVIGLADPQVCAADLGPLDGGGGRRVACDLIAVSGGWAPAVHLLSQQGNRPAFDTERAAFLPGPLAPGQHAAGAVTGHGDDTAQCIAQGLVAGAAAAAAADAPARSRVALRRPAPLPAAARAGVAIRPVGEAPDPPWGRIRKFVDLQNDVTVKDIALANREGYASVEHLKRYTTLGMGTDQGKTANPAGMALLARQQGRPVAALGTTRFRPPYTPVALGALHGAEVGATLAPVRRTALHDRHLAAGAVMAEAGLWMRPWYYPLAGEDMDAAYRREAAHVRAACGIVDVSTLGKIDVQGPDAALFLDRVYANRMDTLKVGRVRYGLMLREDGFLMDDGTVARLAETQYFVTTTTAQAAPVLSMLEYLLEVAWPDLRVHVASITDQWAAMAVAGPHSRAVLAAALDGIDLATEALGHMGWAEGRCAGAPVRVHRASFSGELAYEVFCPTGFGEHVWDRLMAAGADHDLRPYGTEAMATLRIEKGHIAGAEIDGRTTAADVGLGRMASARKSYTGSVLKERPDLVDPARPRLVGLEVVDASARIGNGALLFGDGDPCRGHGLGHVTSVTWSPVRGRYIGLGLLSGGLDRLGERLIADEPVRGRRSLVTVVDPVFYDPAGEKLHA